MVLNHDVTSGCELLTLGGNLKPAKYRTDAFLSPVSGVRNIFLGTGSYGEIGLRRIENPVLDDFDALGADGTPFLCLIHVNDGRPGRAFSDARMVRIALQECLPIGFAKVVSSNFAASMASHVNPFR